MLRTPASGDSWRCTACAVIFGTELDIDVGGPTAGGDMGRQAARELLLIAAHREAQSHANVSPVTLQLGGFDRLGASQGLSEIWVRIFFDQCAKFGGSN